MNSVKINTLLEYGMASDLYSPRCILVFTAVIVEYSWLYSVVHETLFCIIFSPQRNPFVGCCSDIIYQCIERDLKHPFSCSYPQSLDKPRIDKNMCKITLCISILVVICLLIFHCRPVAFCYQVLTV